MRAYLSLDQSKSRTGWAFWKESLDRPLVGSWPKLGDPETPRGKVFVKVHMNLSPMLATHGFTSLCYEEAVNPQHFARQTSPEVPFLLINIAGHIESFCSFKGIRCNAIPSNKWRPWFLDGVGRGHKRWELKDFVVERCRQLGMAPRNDDEADALGILDYHLYLEGITPPWRMENVLLPALGGCAMTQSVNRINGGPAVRADNGMVATLHQHSALHRGVMLDWLRHCDEAGEPHPSNEAIAARFNLPIEAARTLLADLADRGEIRITYARGERQITLAPPKPKRDLGTPRMLPPSVKTPQKPRISEEECVARIKRIMARAKTAAPDAAIPAVQSADGNVGGSDVDRSAARAPSYPTGAAGPLEGRERGQRSAHQSPTRRPPVTPPEEVAMPAPAHCPSSAAKPVQINFRPQPGHVERVAAMAAAEGVPMTAVARRIFERGMAADDAPVTLTGKPMVPAAVLRAANEAGVDLHDFCSTLLRIGLAAYDRGER